MGDTASQTFVASVSDCEERVTQAIIWQLRVCNVAVIFILQLTSGKTNIPESRNVARKKKSTTLGNGDKTYKTNLHKFKTLVAR